MTLTIAAPLAVDTILSHSEHTPDQALALLLSRLASVQGHSVPVHRFSMSSISATGAPIAESNLLLRAMELWMSALPEGAAEVLEGSPEKVDFPLLWLAFDGSSLKLLRGRLSNGGYLCESASGEQEELPANTAMDGNILLLRPQLLAGDAEMHETKTARDWFYYAIKKRKWFFIEAVLATAMASMLALAASFYTMQVYDRVVPTQSYPTLIVLTIGTFMALAVELLMKQLRSHMVDKACKAIDQELSGVFFGRVLAIRMDARPNSVGTFAAQVKHFEMVRNFMTSSTLFLFADAPFVLFFIAVIGMIGGMIALVPLILLPISIGAGLYAKMRLAKLTEDMMRDANLKNGLLIEAIDGIEAIKAVGGEWKMLDRWRHLTAESAEKELRIRATTTIATNITQTVQQISYILMIAAGVYSINAGLVTMGALIACSIISNRALGPIAQIAGLIVQWQHAKVALNGLDGIMKLPCDRNAGDRLVIPESCAGQLRLEEAAYSYNPANAALKPANLNLRKGERVAVLGSVGSGKSTLIKLLSGLYRPSAGRVFLDGIDMAHLAPEFMREHIGYLTQDVRLFNGTLRDNLVMGLPSPSDAQILLAASQTGLDRVIKQHPKGLELPIMEGGRGLSGGQRQLVGLTRMLLANPSVLLLDEPTASMDGELEAYVMNNIFGSMAADSTIVLATHKSGMLKLVDRIIVLDQGKIMLDGPRDEVLAKITGGKRAKPVDPKSKPSPTSAPTGVAA